MTTERYTALTAGYIGFLTTLPFVAASPYLLAFAAGGFCFDFIKHPNPGPNGEGNFIINGAATCVVLTPILLPITALTCGIAITGAIIAGLSTIVSYPTAMALDYCNSNHLELDENAPRMSS